MKKKLSLLLVIVLCLSLITGCGKKEEPINNTEPEGVVEEENKPQEEIETLEEEIEEETEQLFSIQDWIIRKHCSPDVEEDDIEYEFSDIKDRVSQVKENNTSEGKEISIYYLHDTLYKINLRYFGDDYDRIIYSLDDDYCNQGFTNIDEIEMCESFKIDGDKDIWVIMDEHTGSLDWDDENNEIIIVNDTIMCYDKDSTDKFYIPLVLGEHDLSLEIYEDVDCNLFKLENIEVLDTLVEYDRFREKETGINRFTKTLPVCYEDSFANLMEISYQNATDYSIIHVDTYDDDGPSFTVCPKKMIGRNNVIEYWISVNFKVISERELNEDWQQIDETERYMIYVRKSEIENAKKTMYIFVPKDNLEYRLTNSALNVEVSGIPYIEVFNGVEPPEETYKVVEQFTFRVVKEIDYTDNYVSIWG